MSRCFPFPPPGYEKKIRSDDVDLLIKDKKEKRHKKEKRDKKKDDKDKKDKERSKDKDREKKDRKEKHKDKKKSKDREKKDEGPIGGKHSENHQQAEVVKDTQFMEIGTRVTDEERGRRDQMVENLPRRDQKVENLPRRDQIHSENHQQAQVVKDTQFSEIGRRVADEERKRRDQTVENLPRRDQKVENLPRRDQMLENVSRRDQMVENVPRRDQMVENLPRRVQIPESLPLQDSKNEDIVGKLVDKYFDSGFQDEKIKDRDEPDKKPDRKSFKDEGRVLETTVFPSFPGAEQRRVGGTARPVENKGGQTLSEGRVMENTVVPSFTAADQRRVGVAPKPMDSKDGRDKKTDRHKVKDEGRVTEDILVPSFSGAEQRRAGSTTRPEKETERKMERKEKNKDLAGSEKQVGKHKHRDGEKKKKDKTASEKEKKKEKVIHENRKQDMMIEIPKDHINTLNIKPIQIPKDAEKSGSGEEKHRKRKECEANGILHEHDVRPNKLPRTTLSPHPLTLNGRKTEPCQPATHHASAMPRDPSNVRFDNKGIKVNGLIIQAQPTSINSTSPSIPPVQAQPTSINSTSPSIPPVQAQPTSISLTSPSIPPIRARENGEASKKSPLPPLPPPPHPDSKYLSQILTVPKVDDWTDFDDQEWLFSSNSLQEKKPKAVSSGVDGLPQVWDRAVRIDSADVCALPYVIPY